MCSILDNLKFSEDISLKNQQSNADNIPKTLDVANDFSKLYSGNQNFSKRI